MPEPGEARRRRLALKGKMSPGRRAWLKAQVYSFMLYIRDKNDPEAGTDYEVGDEVTIYVISGKNRAIIDFTQLTQQELVATKHIFDMAFANALPVVIRRDAVAEEAFNEGDTSNLRLYREVPRLFVREGPEFPDRPVLLRGPDWAPTVDDDFEASIGHTRGMHVDLPQRYTQPRPAEDDPEADD